MQGPPDLNERLARIDEKMATRGAVFAAMLAVGFLALVVAFTR